MGKRAYEVTIERRVTQTVRVVVKNAETADQAIAQAMAKEGGPSEPAFWYTSQLDDTDMTKAEATITADVPMDGCDVDNLAHVTDRNLMLLSMVSDDLETRACTFDELSARQT